MNPEVQRPRRGCRYWLRLLIAAVLSLPLIYIVWVVANGLSSVNEWLHPARLAVRYTPADAGLEYEEAAFVTEDGLTLRGWYLPSRNRAAVMVLHGLSGNRESVFHIAAALQKHEYGVLVFDVRAHGESDGEKLSHIWRDGLAALDYLQARQDVDANRIGAWGFSLGGAISIQAATERPEIRAVMTDGLGPANFEDWNQPNGLGEWLYLPYDLTFYTALEARSGGFARMSTSEAIAKLSPRPVLLVTMEGQRLDQQTEYRLNQRFFAAAGEPKTLWPISGAAHGTGYFLDPEEYEARMFAFFDAALLSD